MFLSSQTHKLMAATKFSDYLGLKDYKKAIKHLIHLRLAQLSQKFMSPFMVSFQEQGMMACVWYVVYICILCICTVYGYKCQLFTLGSLNS